MFLQGVGFLLESTDRCVSTDKELETSDDDKQAIGE